MTRVSWMVAAIALLMLTPVMSAAPPMRVALLVDTSATTAKEMVHIREAVAAFLEALPPEHEVLLVTTGRHTQVRVPPTSDRSKLKGNIGGMLTDNGPTSLMDALTEVDGRFMKKAADRWPVFVVITGDGSENSKEIDDQGFNRWVTDIAKRGVSANAVVLMPANGLPGAIASTIVKVTHGHYSTMSNGAGLPDAMTQLAHQLADDAAKRP